MSSHSLRVKCPTWEHVESFCLRKVKKGSLLPARVPFAPAVGDQVQLGLQTPDGSIVEIVTTVQDARRAPDGKKSAVLLRLLGFEGELKERLLGAARDSREGGRPRPIVSQAPVSTPRTRTGAPVPIPTDAPIDELVEPIEIPSAAEVPSEIAEVFRELQAELERLKELGAHEVLGVDWNADVVAIRSAYFALTKKYHPDVYARYRSPAIALLVSELFIYVNRAYDRLRDSAVAAGQAIVAGPALLPHKGWIADFGDLGTVRPRPALRTDDFSGPVPLQTPSEGAAPPTIRWKGGRSGAVGTRDGESDEPAPGLEAATPLADVALFSDVRLEDRGKGAQTLASRPGGIEEVDLSALREQGRELVANRDFEGARGVLAEILDHDPRDRKTRALYHVAYGRNLLSIGKAIEATTQFEVALAHDVGCQPAIDALDEMKPQRERRSSWLKRLFRR